MLQRAIATLGETVRPHLGLSKDRVETLAMIVIAMVSARTVNLSHLAAERPGDALVASTYRRLQRFFQHVRLEQDWAAPMVERLSGLKGSNKWYLALDRTQWQIGGAGRQFPGAGGGDPALPGAADVDDGRWPRLLGHKPAHRPDAALSRPVRRCQRSDAGGRPRVRGPGVDGFSL